jgi:hypothetical protein
MWGRLLGGPTVLIILVWRLGTGPFLDAVRTINGWSLAAATGIAALTTVSCTWRWSLVARSLGVGMPMRAAVPAYYRSQFLNTTLPSGVLGDVHRAVRHGRDVGDENRALRAVAWATLRRPGRADRAGNNRAARSAVAGALVHAGRSIAVMAGGWASSSCVGRCPMAGRSDRGGSCA